MYNSGDCIFYVTNNYSDGKSKEHLFVVIFSVKDDGDMTIIIPMDKIPDQGYYDKTVILEIGCHDFVKEPTYMNFFYSRLRTKLWLDRNVTRAKEPPVSEKVYREICNGITKSEDTPVEVYNEYLMRISKQ